MRGLKVILSTTTLLMAVALASTGNAQVVIGIGAPPICSYGYYDYAPYSCAPVGFYGPGYFYNGIFLGMGPWSGWGYSHGWGGHRFSNGGGGRYNGGGGFAANHGHVGGPSVRRASNSGGSHTRAFAGGSQGAGARSGGLHGTSHAPVAQNGGAHGGGFHGGGGGSHGGGGGGSHGGGGHR